MGKPANCAFARLPMCAGIIAAGLGNHKHVGLVVQAGCSVRSASNFWRKAAPLALASGVVLW
jgi:hypothetical protein